MRRAALLVALMLAGCDGMSNDAIIREVQKCKAADMDAVQLANMAHGDQTFRVECRARPK